MSENPSTERDDPRLRQILDEASDMPADRRPAYLDEACGGDSELRAQVDALLRALDQASEFLADPPAEGTAEAETPPSAHEAAETRIGRYKVLEKLGEGGMGVVYVAEQQHPVRRRVALKVIKLGMDTRQVIARFEAERQALALMDHPNIARVLDAGTTEAGKPYFVMELVRGVCITEYCDTNHLTPRQRLQLFVPVCRAVQHAHQNGIIHRDLKPSNVLVTLHDGQPVPKVIDFGVAKATAGRLTDKTVYTEFHQFVGTPEYMSPEQAEMSGLDVDTRADVYALGVLLYELLTGTTPFDAKELRRAAYAEIQRIIREVEPPTPSTRLSTLGELLTGVATRRSTDPRKLGTLVRGDLDWIVMRCLEKDRTRRYETANALAMDVQRHLNDEPLEASPPSAIYRLRKVARRNKPALAFAGLVLIFVATAGGAIGWEIRNRAGRQLVLEQQVAAALDEAEKAARRDDLIEASSAVKRAAILSAGGRPTALLQDRVTRWQTDLAVVRRLQDAAMIEGQYASNREQVLPEYEAAFREYGIEALSMTVAEAAGRVRARTPALQISLIAGLDHWRSLGAKPHARYARAHVWLSDLLAAVDTDPWRRRLRTTALRNFPPDVVALASSPDEETQAPYTQVYLAEACSQEGRPDLAMSVLRRAQVRYPGDFSINFGLGQMLHQADPGDRDALSYCLIAVSLRPNAAGPRLVLADVLKSQGKLEEAITACQTAIDRSPNEPMAHNALAVLLDAQGKPDEAIAEFHKALALQPDNDHVRVSFGRLLVVHNRLEEAEAEFRRAIELNPDSAEAHDNLGQILEGQHKDREARAERLKAVKLNPRLVPVGLPTGGGVRELSEGIRELRRAVLLEPDDAHAHNLLGVFLLRQGHLDEAVAESSKAVELKPDEPVFRCDLGAALLEQKKLTEAIVEFRKAVSLAPGSSDARSDLAIALHRQGKVDEAMAELDRAIELDPRQSRAHHERASILFEQGELDKAAGEDRVAAEMMPTLPDARQRWRAVGPARKGFTLEESN